MHSDYRHDPFSDASTALAITGEVQMVPAGSPYEIRLNEVPLRDTPSSIVLRVRDALAAAITTAGATSCTVINGAWFENDDVITIDSEQLLVTNVSGATLTVTRGHNGTTAATHTIGTPVYGPVWSEVAATPAAGQYWPDYGTRADSDASWNTGTVQFNSADAGKVVYINYKGTGTLGSVSPARNYPSWMSEYGDGSDGHFVSTANVTLDGLKQYKSFVLQAAHTLTVGANPLAIICQGPVIIAGTINGAGSAGATSQSASGTAAGGAGKGGGGTGGGAYSTEATYSADAGGQATGAAGGRGAAPAGGPGGIGYALGATVSAGAAVSAATAAWMARHFIPSAGAGGGGGSGAKGGGGAGGSVVLVAKRLVNTGTITLTGGAVGTTSTPIYMGGGGGGGASVRVVAPSVALTGTINVSGGAGGDGAAGTTAADAGGAGWSATFEIGG